MSEDIDIIDNNEEYVQYLYNNLPVLITYSNSKPILNELLNCFDESVLDSQIPCVDQTKSEKFNNYSEKRSTLLLSDYLSTIASYKNALYLKDWHITRDTKFKLNFPPFQFEDDWLNWYYVNYLHHLDDYIFLYCGPSETSTGLHHDVCCSYSWSYNLVGKKKWIMWHPNDILQSSVLFLQSMDLYDKLSCKEHIDIVSYVSDNYYNEFLRFLLSCKVRRFEAIQDCNQIMFVPSGWYHCVANMSDLSPDKFLSNEDEAILRNYPWLNYCTVSLNCNWFNGFNIDEIWNFILKELHLIRLEIYHLLGDSCNNETLNIYMTLDEWNIKCDDLLRVNSSINVFMFIELLASRVCILSFIFNKCHCIHDKCCTDNDWIESYHFEWISIFCAKFNVDMITVKDMNHLINQFSDETEYYCNGLSKAEKSLEEPLNTTTCNNRQNNRLSSCWKIENSDNAYLIEYNKHQMQLSTENDKWRIWNYSCSQIILVFSHITGSSSILKHVASVFKIASEEETSRLFSLIIDKVQSVMSI